MLSEACVSYKQCNKANKHTGLENIADRSFAHANCLSRLRFGHKIHGICSGLTHIIDLCQVVQSALNAPTVHECDLWPHSYLIEPKS